MGLRDYNIDFEKMAHEAAELAISIERRRKLSPVWVSPDSLRSSVGRVWMSDGRRSFRHLLYEPPLQLVEPVGRQRIRARRFTDSAVPSEIIKTKTTLVYCGPAAFVQPYPTPAELLEMAAGLGDPWRD
jgi:hypothetical protein